MPSEKIPSLDDDLSSEQKMDTIDVLVVGSGAGGMAASITAKFEGLNVVCIEKADKYGGSSAFSGGVIWIPDNPHVESAGAVESHDDAFAYLDSVVTEDVPRQKLKAFIKKSAQMLAFFEQNTLLKYEPAPVYPDYYADQPGARMGSRSLDPIPYTRRKLGKKLSDEMARPFKDEDNKFYMTAKEAHDFFSFTPLAPLVVVRTMIRYYLDIPFRLKGESDNRLTLGKALVGRLRKSMDDMHIPLKLATGLKDLEPNQQGWLATIEHGGKEQQLIARNVVLATGGFEQNQAMREKYLPAPTNTQWSAANPHNTGDAIALADKLNLQTDMMGYAWWSPTYVLPDGQVEALIVNKSMPGCVIVNAGGKRFCNEAAPYEDFVKQQYQAHSEELPSIPAWFIFDARYRREYPIGSILEPAKYVKDERRQVLFDAGWIKKAASLEALAELCDIDVVGLKGTVAAMAAFAQQGKDVAFGKGDQPIDRYYSDHRLDKNPCLAAIDEAPFYAIEIYPGDLGTKGGLVTNEHAQVLDQQGRVVHGLYATGNTTASVMGNSYPGAGATLGPALTFAYIAALHIAKGET